MPRREANEPSRAVRGGTDAIWKSEPNVHELRRVLAEYERDPTAAIPALESLASRGSMAGMVYLGEAYRKRGDPGDTQNAKYWYERADESGSPDGAFMLGRLKANEGDATGAFEVFKRSSERGLLPAIYRLGKLYELGKGTARDLGKAKELFEHATKRGHFYAKRDLGLLYVRGAFGTVGRIRGLGLLASLAGNVIALTVSAFPHAPTIDERMKG